MNPEYFHTTLTIGEANDYLVGLGMRKRSGWEQTRLLADVQARCAGNKEGFKFPLPWEEEKKTEISQEDIDYLNKMREQREKMINDNNIKYGK